MSKNAISIAKTSQKVVSYVNQKGGVGKSTILFHHAYHALERGLKVLVCDFDTQGNASSALLGDDYEEAFEGHLGSGCLLGKCDSSLPIAKNKSGINVVFKDNKLLDVEDADLSQVVESIANNFKALSEFDLILIDCPPTVGKRVIGALYASTNIIAPIEARKFAIDGIFDLLHTINAVTEDRDNLVFEGVVINRVNSRSPRQQNNIKMIRDALGKQVFITELVEREPISDAIESGVPVWTMRHGSARIATKEMKSLMKEIDWRLG